MGYWLGCVNFQGRTALHFVTQAGSTDCLNMLINHGADVNAVDVENAAPLHLATAHDVINILLAKGGDPTIKMINQDSSKNSVFSQHLRTVPDECNSVLTSLIYKNSVPLRGQGLEVKLNFKLWQE